MSPISHAPASTNPLAINAVLTAARQAADVLCDRWTLSLLLLAHTGITRFSDFIAHSGMASRQLTTRLTTLEAQEIIVRLPYSRRPLRYGYQLTPMGLALFDVIASMARWEADFATHSDGAHVTIAHPGCASAVPELHCAHCSAAVHARNVGELRVNQREISQLPNKTTPYRRTAPSRSSSSSVKSTPLAGCTGIFGDKWSIEVLVLAFMQVRSFGAFQLHTGISTNVLSDRLDRLVEAGVLRQTSLDEPGRTGSYLLTERGIGLYPILLTIQAWADDWLPERLRSPIRLKHLSCGHALLLAMRCRACSHPLAQMHSVFRVE